MLMFRGCAWCKPPRVMGWPRVTGWRVWKWVYSDTICNECLSENFVHELRRKP